MESKNKNGSSLTIGRIPCVFVIISIVVAVCFTLLIVNGRHPGLTNDSVAYYAAAHNLAGGNGLLLYDGSRMVQWPPLYPVLLALMSESRDHFLTMALLINGFCFVCSILLFGWIVSLLQLNFAIRLFGAVAILTSFSLFEIYTMAWSEALFVLFLLLWFATLLYAIRVKFDSRALIQLGLFVALACLTRYAGLALWFATLGVMLFSQPEYRKHRAKRLALFSAISLLPVTFWLLQNYIVSTSMTGDRGVIWRPLSHYLWRFFDIISGWFLPMTLPFSIRLVILLIAGISAIIFITKSYQYNNLKILPKSWNLNSITFITSILFIFSYSILIIVSGWLGYASDANERFLAPLFFPVLLIFLQIINNFYRKLSGLLIKIFVSTIFFAWLIYPSARIIKHVNKYIEEDRGDYSKVKWDKNETLRWLVANESVQPLYASDPAAVYWFTNKICKETAHRNHSLKSFVKGLPKDGAVLIWFTHHQGFYQYSLKELSEVVDLNIMTQTQDGAIYSMQRKTFNLESPPKRSNLIR